MSRVEWRSVFRQLVAMGLLVVDVEGHGGLRLGPDCRAVLRGERPVQLRREPKRRRERPAAAAKPAALDRSEDQALFQALRAHRLALAQAQGVPPYVIFHDTALIEMARDKPRHLHQLARVAGVGEVKLDRYGADFLAVIAGHGAE